MSPSLLSVQDQPPGSIWFLLKPRSDLELQVLLRRSLPLCDVIINCLLTKSLLLLFDALGVKQQKAGLRLFWMM